MRIPRSLLALMILALFVAVGCGDDEPGPTEPQDTTRPLVSSTDPDAEDTGVPVTEDVTVVFNEAMDPASATGNVTLSSGNITDLQWSNDRTLVIDHGAWAEGARITVTLGTGLKDKAGNGLASEFSFGFWTMSSQVELLTTDPASGATGVLVNPTVRMLFSQSMNLATVRNATSVNSVDMGKAPIDFTLTAGDDNWIFMTFDAELPQSTRIDVVISTDAQSQGGTPLAEEETFFFTTGTESDTTPPNLVSAVPSNGSTIPASTGTLVFTFDEPIDDASFIPSRIGGQFWVLFEGVVGEPVWSENYTVLTVTLPTPLPAGLPIMVEFATYQDRTGNVQTTPIEYSVTVAGQADPFPMVDGLALGYDDHWQEYEGEVLVDEGWGDLWTRFELESGNDYRRVDYETPDFMNSESWEYFRRSANMIELRGFHELDEGTPVDVLFTPGVIAAKIPWAAQSWSGDVTAAFPDGDGDLHYEVVVTGPTDRVATVPGAKTNWWMGKQRATEIVWIDAWKWVLTFEMSVDGTVLGTGIDTSWYAPAIGMIESSSEDEDPQDGWRDVSEMYLMSIVLPE